MVRWTRGLPCRRSLAGMAKQKAGTPAAPAPQKDKGTFINGVFYVGLKAKQPASQVSSEE